VGYSSFHQLTVTARWGWNMYSLSLGNPCGGDRPRTTSSAEVACCLPRRGRTACSYGTA
jgi:hypothetical protein